MGTVVEKFQYIEGTKQAIKKAIKGKGVEVSDTDTFRSYAEKIESIGGGGGSSVAEYKFINTLELQTNPAQPYSEDNNFIYTSFADYINSNKEFCCTANIYDGNTGDVYKLFDGNETTYSAPSFFFRFNEKKKVKKLHIVITSADYWGGTPIIYGTNYPDKATSQDTSYWTEIHNFNGVVGEHTIDLSNVNYQYFWFSDDRINVSKFEVITESGVIAITLSSANMTPKLIPYADNYMQVITQDWHNGSEIIPSQTLTFKPYDEGGCLVNYNDDGKATNLKMYLLNPTGEEVITEVPFVQPVLTENGTIGGDSFAVDDDFKSSEHPVWHAFDGDNSSYWRDANIPGYIDIYNPNPLVIKNIRWGFFYSYPTAGNVQGSNDGDEWELIKEWTNNKESDFDIDLSDNTKALKYYRINISSVNMDVIHCSNLTITGKEIASVTYDKPIYVLAPDDSFELEGYSEKTQVADLNIPERLS